MNRTRTTTVVAVVLCAFGFLLTVFDFLALHDIRNEYVSTRILNHLDITLSEELPEWTATRGEWDIVRISHLFRFAFYIFCMVVFIHWGNELRTTHQE